MIFNLRVWPVVVGILVDTIGSLLVGVVYVIGIFGVQIAQGTPPSDEPLGTPHLIVAEIVGLCVTGVGGYVAARLGGTRHVHYGIAVGGGALVVWLLVELLVPADALPGWYDIASVLGVVPAGMLGGLIAAKRANQRVKPTASRASAP
jgi:hypothetical protein